MSASHVFCGLWAASILVSERAVWAADKPDIVGRWDITIQDGNRQPVGAAWLGVKQEDGKLVAVFQPEAGGPGPVAEIKFENGLLEFRTGERLWKGRLAGGQIVGEVTRGNEKRPFVARRFAPRPEVAGTWAVVLAGGRGQQEAKLVLRDDGKSISGTWTGARGRELPIQEARLEDGVLSFTIERAGRGGGGRQTVAYSGRVAGDRMVGKFGPAGRQEREWSATRQREWGEPIKLFNGKDLTGWKLIGGESFGNWKVENGELVNTAAGPNIRTIDTFRDFKLHIEFNVPEHGNSGVYLRGRYEVQIADDHGKGPSPGGCGSMYGRIVASENASKPAGEWNAFDITLIGQYVTVVLNGKTVIDNQEIEGITGGAIDSYEEEPGPIYLQGDHSALKYRNIVLTPAKPAGQ